MWPKRERLTDAVTPLLMEAVDLRPGETVLDIGCGGGKAALRAGEIVGPEGAVVGADISRPLLGLAERRAAELGMTNVSFVHCDVQVDPIADRLFDAAISQFGVMFFDDPVAAFSSIARHLRPGGRVVFACWRPVDENPWHPGTVLAPYASASPGAAGRGAAGSGAAGRGASPIPDAPMVGPFAFGHPGRVTGILEQAGFSDVNCTQHDLVVEAPPDAVADEEQLVVSGVGAESVDDARAALARHLRKFGDPPGMLRLPLAFHLVTAHVDPDDHGARSPKDQKDRVVRPGR
jgi:SAM-dependent methyltransferase